MTDVKMRVERHYLENQLALHERLVRQANEAKTEADRIRDEIILPLVESLRRDGQDVDTLEIATEDGTVKVTLPRQGTKITVNGESLLEHLPPSDRVAITKSVLDPDRLDAWLEDPHVDQETRDARRRYVATYTVVAPGPVPAPRYLRSTKSKRRQPEPEQQQPEQVNPEPQVVSRQPVLDIPKDW